MSDARVVVVGGGVGGLAVAARLAARGLAVTLCEAAPVLGGKLGVAEVDGARFDTGPSLLTLPQVVEETFADTGGWPDGLRLRRLDPLATARFADGVVLDTGPDLPGTVERISAALGPVAAAAWAGLLAHGRRVWAATAEPFLHTELRGAASLAALAVQRPADLALVAPWRSLRQLGTAHLGAHPHLVTLLDRYATYTGSDPRRAPAALVTVAYAEQRYGGWYLDGGLGRLGGALADRAAALGAELRTGSAVTALVVRAGAVRGVRLADGSTLRADAVVVNADAAAVYGPLLAGAADLPPGRRAALQAARLRLARAPRSYAGFVLLGTVHGPRPAGLAHHSVAYPALYDAEFDALRAGRLVADPTVYLAAPDDPAVTGPAGQAPYFVLVNAARHAPPQPGPGGGLDWDDDDLRAGYAAVVQARLDRLSPGLSRRLQHIEVRTPADLERATGAPGGAIYGTSSDGPAAAFLRPRNRSPLPGLTLVGGSSHPGGGLPLVLLSARIAAARTLAGLGALPRGG